VFGFVLKASFLVVQRAPALETTSRSCPQGVFSASSEPCYPGHLSSIDGSFLRCPAPGKDLLGGPACPPLDPLTFLAMNLILLSFFPFLPDGNVSFNISPTPSLWHALFLPRLHFAQSETRIFVPFVCPPFCSMSILTTPVSLQFLSSVY